MAKFVLGELSENHELTQKIKESLTKASRQRIVFIIVDKMKKVGDTVTKALQFNFEEGQTLTLVLRKDGDVIQIKQNGKAVPLLTVMDYDKPEAFFASIEDLGLRIRANHEKFNVRRAKARVVIPRKGPQMTLKRRLDMARQALKEIGEDIENKQALVQSKKAELEAMKNEGTAA